MNSHVNESKPIRISAKVLEYIKSKDGHSSRNRIDLSDDSSSDSSELTDIIRSKRNCLTYGTNKFQRPSKWMCW
ncbi:unnamed protein product [Adineta steineri]|uniref:Uncharacterized protein n=1 Tax=Adineta steineri TaxID=433720 RepID=A0A819CTG2_9BILA|nr:unnamed protein product [Adineta steineri]CAF1501965.1 unnamed protein product [Adineta steineri]CAF3485738.1 unnamed protein product [Adineta steineri]CAF3817293.1 unnamed protein product [Adineta steineri]CAF3928941.1 unnamed protein product [Adineta steineri]